MRVFDVIYTCRMAGLLMILMLFSGCHYSGAEWRITVGLDKPKEKVFIDGERQSTVMICLDGKGGSGYPTNVKAVFDDDRYVGMLVGQCMQFKGKRISVKFATPSSGKYAYGTYTVVTDE